MEENEEEIKSDPTIKEWFESTLPADLQAKAFANLKANCKNEKEELEVLNTTRPTFQNALNSAFVLGNTDEGYTFWAKVRDEYATVVVDQTPNTDVN